MIGFIIKALRFALRTLEAPKGRRLATAQGDVARKVAGAHRYIQGKTPITNTWAAMKFAVIYENTNFPRCHRRGNANRYALGFTSA